MLTIGFFNPAIQTKIFPSSRNPEYFYWPIPILVMTSQHDVQILSSITTTVDLEYTLLVFPTILTFMIQLTLIVAFTCNHSFETKMMHDCPLLAAIESVHIFHFVKDGAYYCYCAYILHISRYSHFLSPMLTNTEILLRGLKVSGESRS